VAVQIQGKLHCDRKTILGRPVSKIVGIVLVWTCPDVRLL